MSPGAVIHSDVPLPLFFEGFKRITSSGVINGRSICSTLALMWLAIGARRDPEKLKLAFCTVLVPVIFDSSSAVSYWFGAYATRTWQFETMLSLGPYSSTIWRMTVIDDEGRRHSMDVQAESVYDAAHVFVSSAKSQQE